MGTGCTRCIRDEGSLVLGPSSPRGGLGQALSPRVKGRTFARSPCSAEPWLQSPRALPVCANEPVLLNVYDLSTNSCDWTLANSLLQPLGAGFFHCGVEVHGWEWSFFISTPGGGDASSQPTGVASVKPRRCGGYPFLESVPMGVTPLSEEAVMLLIQELEPQWIASSYNVLKKNCHHFCNELCRRLGVGPVPAWVTRLADTGRAVGDASNLECCVKPPRCCGRISRCATDHASNDIVVESPMKLPYLPLDHRLER